jgi:hypothetical protein
MIMAFRWIKKTSIMRKMWYAIEKMDKTKEQIEDYDKRLEHPIYNYWVTRADMLVKECQRRGYFEV